MEIEIRSELRELAAGEAIAVCVFEDRPHLDFAVNDRVRACVEAVLESGEFRGEAETSILFHAADGSHGTGARRMLLIGLGQRSDVETRTFARAGAAAGRRARESHIGSLHLVMASAGDAGLMTRAFVEGTVMGLYENGFYQKSEAQPSLEKMTIISSQDLSRLTSEVRRGRIVADAVNWTRRLADEPGGSLPPRVLALRAAEMAKEFGLGIETLNADEIRERGMGGLWNVGKGADEPPVLIVLRYEPAGVKLDDEVWAFVGKGITFDTGGISIKHGLDMFEMKTDMAGGAAVMGAFRAIAQLKPQRRIIGIIPSAENMPSGRALKPGDVIKMLSGHTMEVVDTDAEGRLVLADGITYARQLGATRIVDLATLTGSIVVALGDHRAGLFSNDDEWAGRVEEAARLAGEPAWRMPVSDDYKKSIESPIADFKNYGGRPDATAAALLLSKFVEEVPWAHLDIAGTAWLDEPQPHSPGGSTGTGVRTLVELACGPWVHRNPGLAKQ